MTYLNPDWTPGDGGELVLYPFPEPPVKVEPVMGRVVLFSAANMLHRVLPSGKPRMCYTTWFFAKSPETFGDGRSSGTVAKPSPGTGTETRFENEDAAALEEPARCSARTRANIFWVVHAEEWASIEAAHPDTPARAEALATHWKRWTSSRARSREISRGSRASRRRHAEEPPKKRRAWSGSSSGIASDIVQTRCESLRGSHRVLWWMS